MKNWFSSSYFGILLSFSNITCLTGSGSDARRNSCHAQQAPPDRELSMSQQSHIRRTAVRIRSVESAPNVPRGVSAHAAPRRAVPNTNTHLSSFLGGCVPSWTRVVNLLVWDGLIGVRRNHSEILDQLPAAYTKHTRVFPTMIYTTHKTCKCSCKIFLFLAGDI